MIGTWALPSTKEANSINMVFVFTSDYKTGHVAEFFFICQFLNNTGNAGYMDFIGFFITLLYCMVL